MRTVSALSAFTVTKWIKLTAGRNNALNFEASEKMMTDMSLSSAYSLQMDSYMHQEAEAAQAHP